MQRFENAIRNDVTTVDTANDEEKQLAKKIREFTSKSQHEKKEVFNIMNWYFSKEEKWSLILLKLNIFITFR